LLTARPHVHRKLRAVANRPYDRQHRIRTATYTAGDRGRSPLQTRRNPASTALPPLEPRYSTDLNSAIQPA